MKQKHRHFDLVRVLYRRAVMYVRSLSDECADQLKIRPVAVLLLECRQIRDRCNGHYALENCRIDDRGLQSGIAPVRPANDSKLGGVGALMYEPAAAIQHVADRDRP